MSRFQAQSNAVLDAELDDLRERLGLRRNQRADLLREIAALASWVVRQAEAGRNVEARRGRDVEPLDTPLLARLRQRRTAGVGGPIELTDSEVERLADALDRGFSPTPALRKVLSRLAEAKRKPPKLRWKSGAA
jgi:hypothetical protein